MAGVSPYRVVWVVVVGRGSPNHRKRVFMLVFGWCGGWWGAEEGPTPQKRARSLVFGRCGWWWWPEEGTTCENERDCSFSWVVGCGGGQRKVKPTKTSSRARFRGVLAKGRPNFENERSCSFSRGVGGGGQRNGQRPKTSVTARFRGVWVVVVVRKGGGGGSRKMVQPPKTSIALVFGG